MLRRLVPLLPAALALLLSACAEQTVRSEGAVASDEFRFEFTSLATSIRTEHLPDLAQESEADATEAFENHVDYQMPSLADSILEHGFSLVGTPYRYGGSSTQTGFDCSGFVSYLYRKEAGLKLPRSTREMIKLDAPKVARNELEPGDLVLFNDRGRGRVSHAGIYIGDDQFIHSSSRRSGGVRVDSLDDAYWRASFMQAKRVLAMVSTGSSGSRD